MAYDVKAATPDTSLPTTGFLIGADSQAATNPSIYSVQAVATALTGSTTVNGATVTADAPVLNMTQTWNNAAVSFTGWVLNITRTASDVNSTFMDLQEGSVSKFKVLRYGLIQVPGATGGLADTSGSRFNLDTNGLVFGSGQQLAWSNNNTIVPDAGFTRSAAAVVKVTNGSTGAGAIEFQEQTAPAAPAANYVRLYAEDNGAGKTRLMALFATGAAQQVAIEP